MALSDYWSLLCPMAIEAGFNIALNPNMTDDPDHLRLYRQPNDPLIFEPVFNPEADLGEPGPQIGVRLRNPKSTHKDYMRYVLNKISVEQIAAKTWLKSPEAFYAYIWKPIPIDPVTTAWSQIPQSTIEEWTEWQLHYLQQARSVFFHEHPASK
jgi:hypothetical protein